MSEDKDDLTALDVLFLAAAFFLVCVGIGACNLMSN